MALQQVDVNVVAHGFERHQALNRGADFRCDEFVDFSFGQFLLPVESPCPSQSANVRQACPSDFRVETRSRNDIADGFGELADIDAEHG